MTAYPGPGTAPLTVPVGYKNAPGYPGSLTASSMGAGSLVAGTTYEYLDFTTGDMRGIATSNVTFKGCLFASNRVADANAAGSDATGCSNITFSYCTFAPSAVASPPVAYGNGYEYGIDQRMISGMTVDHCEFWGFGDGIQLAASSQTSPVVITNNFFHDPSANGGGAYHVDGILSSDGAGIEYVTVSGNTIAIPASDTNCIGFQVPEGGGGTPYSHLTITGNYLSGDNVMVDIGTGTVCDHITFTGNVWAADYEPGTDPLYSDAFLNGSGSAWSGNTMFVPSASPLDGANSSWMAPGNSGLYWWPGDSNPSSGTQIIGHTVDYGAAMTSYTLFSQGATGQNASDDGPLTLGIQFSVSQPCTLNALWFSSPAGSTALPGTIALYTVTGGTLVHSETASWSGAAGSGWVRAPFTSRPSLSPGVNYVAAVFYSGAAGFYNGTNNYWSSGAGAGGVANGPLSAPNSASAANGQDVFNSGASLAFPASTFSASNYWVDPEVSPVVSGLLMASFP